MVDRDAEDEAAQGRPAEPESPPPRRQPGDPVAASAPEATLPAQLAVDPELVEQSKARTSASAARVTPSVRDRWESVRRSWWQTRYPLVIATLLLFAISIPRSVESVVTVTSAFPVQGTIALFVWAAYALPLIWLINQFDFFEHETASVIGIALAWGGVIASSMAVTANQAMFSIITSVAGEEFTLSLGPAFAAPTTEELLKALGILAVILLAFRGIRSAIDGFIVGAMVGLGFQVMENFVYTGNLLLSGRGQEEPFGVVAEVFLVRGLGSGLWSHAAYSGLAGAGIGFAISRTDRSPATRLGAVVAGLGLAWFLHFLWNLPAPGGPGGMVAIAKGLFILGLVLFVLLRAQGRESHLYTRYLKSVHDPAVVTSAEIEQLRTYRSRQAAVRTAARNGGERAASAKRALQRGQADLSVAMGTGDLDAVAQARRRIARARTRLAAAGMLPPEVGRKWGMAALWAAILGVLLPVVGAGVAAVLALIGTLQARRRGAEPASTLRAAWIMVVISLALGIALALLLAV